MDRSAQQDDDSSSRLVDRVGSLIDGKYLVIRLIGQGSTGAVYVCRHIGLDKLVALKVLHREMEHNTSFVERFKLEARAASRLEHPNSVRVLDFGQDNDGSLFIAMEYVEGRDLLQVLEEDGPFGAERTIEVMAQILDVLGVAHAAGIVHRDLKPENILLRPIEVDGVPRELVTVCDFGIAQFAPVRRTTGPIQILEVARPEQRQEAVVAGTPAYMSPEQARAEPQDARSDLYSSGVLLYQLMTLQLPFYDDDAYILARKHCTELPPPPSQFGAVSPALEKICLKALAKKKEDRFQSAREMRAALLHVLASSSETRGREPIASVGPQRWGSPRSFLPPSMPPPSVTSNGMSGTQTPLVATPVTRARAATQSNLSVWGVALLSLCLVLGGVWLVRQSSGAQSIGHAPSYEEHMVQPSAVSVLPPLDTETREAMAARVPNLPELREEVGVSTPREREDDLPPVQPPAGAALPPVAAEPAARTRSAAARAAREATASRASAEVTEPKAVASHESKTSLKAPASTVPNARVATKPADTDMDPVSDLLALGPSLERETASAAVRNEVAASPAPAAPVPAVSTLTLTRTGAASDAVQEDDSPRRASKSVEQPRAATRAAAPVAAPAAPDRARVTISGVEAHSAVSKSSVRGALNMGAITDCYRDALRSGAAPILPLTAQISLTASMSGGITSATLAAPTLPLSLRHCVEQVARRGRVRESDTGAAQASITLAFAPR